MKWYSVKYRPPTDREVLVHCNGSYWLAKYGYDPEPDPDYIQHEYSWYDSITKEEIIVVTHFCIPDPVEIDE